MLNCFTASKPRKIRKTCMTIMIKRTAMQPNRTMEHRYSGKIKNHSIILTFNFLLFTYYYLRRAAPPPWPRVPGRARSSPGSPPSKPPAFLRRQFHVGKEQIRKLDVVHGVFSCFSICSAGNLPAKDSMLQRRQSAGPPVPVVGAALSRPPFPCTDKVRSKR